MTDNAIETITLTRAQMNAVLKAAYPLATEEERDTVLKSAMLSPSTLPIAVEGKVAQLEWRYSEHTSNWYADTPFSQYIAWEISRNAYYLPSISKTPVRAGTTIDEAKAAAQTDYETRILSALISSPGKDGGQEVEEVAYLTRRGDEERVILAKFVTEEDRLHGSNGWTFEPLYTRPQPASTALVEKACAAMNDVLRYNSAFSHLPGEIVESLRRAAAALSASQSTSREGER